MATPYACAINEQQGLIAVSDCTLDAIFFFDLAGSFVKKVGGVPSTDAGSFRAPAGLCWSSEGLLFVCNTVNHRIEVLRADGSFLMNFGMEGSEPSKLYYPSSVCVCDDKIYVVDLNNRVSVFVF